ncbi:OmpA family protein [Croceicoccus ponticola]|uniref:OmpA family protein n=1 Tax=Croceicoccus ponticola TaxID=2217664 RepID=A0A437H0T7_9SPHN|nr:OmpA family protein [Croceicoccus ponticola]RVQ69199.1 OmpA family protein [Croceicoccus ponticola]
MSEVSHKREVPLRIIALISVAAITLAACDRTADPDDAPASTAISHTGPTATPISILRENAEPVVDDGIPTEPLEISVPFAQGGTSLSAGAEKAIAEIVASSQFKLGGDILLRGHTDAVGDDQANLRVSRSRAEAVAKALEEAGATADNITIIPIGEMRPVAPNAKLDGTPDEEGRARNRRVEVTVMPPTSGEDDTAQAGDDRAKQGNGNVGLDATKAGATKAGTTKPD